MYHIKAFFVVCAILLLNNSASLAIPTGSDPASAAADPSMTPDAVPAVAAPPPDSVAAPAPVAGVRDGSNPSGTITEQKNPDGSTITVTRFNGPLPASVFQNPFQDYARLHDVVLQNNIYQAQMIQLQTQVLNQALLRNMFSFPSFPTFPYAYPRLGQFMNPFASPFFGGYPSFYPGYGQPPMRSSK